MQVNFSETGAAATLEALLFATLSMDRIAHDDSNCKELVDVSKRNVERMELAIKEMAMRNTV